MKGRFNGWDGNCNRSNVEQFVQPYTGLLADVYINSSSYPGIVLYLRGGGTLYHICSNYSMTSCRVLYSATNMRTSSYPVNVEPKISPESTEAIIRHATLSNNQSASKFYCDSIIASSTISAAKVYNAVWNDYAEFFERGSKTEPGDLIALDTSSNKE